MWNTSRRCLEQGHRWSDYTAYVIPATKKSEDGSGEVIGCLAIDILGERCGRTA